MWQSNKNFQKGLEFQKVNSFDKAASFYKLAIEDNPNTPQYLHAAGASLMKLDDKKKEAQDYLTKAIDLYNKNLDDECYWIGACYALLEDKDNALEYLYTAIQKSGFYNEYREDAQIDDDFDFLKDDKDFKELIRNRDSEEIWHENEVFHKSKYDEIESSLKEINKKEFSFHLGAGFWREIFIDKTHTEIISLLDSDDTILVEKDPNGNITNFHLDGDKWNIKFLEKIAPGMNDKSYVLIVDDENRYWKVEFQKGRVRYFKQEK